MQVIKTDDIDVEEITANTVSGSVTRQRIIGIGDDKFTISLVNFEKGTVREPDNHDFDQILYIARGKGLIKTEAEEVIVTSGTFVFIPAGEKHSHCAMEDSGFTQVTIGVLLENEY